MEINTRFFSGKRIFITGGTGSFGTKILKRLLPLGVEKVYVYSRDEKKQYEMRDQFPDCRVSFIVGDVRDYARLHSAMLGKAIDVVYHAAALKQVPQCEDHPYEAVLTNICGAQNVKTAAIQNNVGTVVAISTDKAVKPVNVMGMTKAVQERIFLSDSPMRTRFACVRYGNVLGSRGSVVPYFKKKIRDLETIPITDIEMTRFMLTLDEAIDLVFLATTGIERNVVYIKKMPACKIVDLAAVMVAVASFSGSYPVKVIGVRPGEKIHEVLISEEEMVRTTEFPDYYIIHPHPFSSDTRGEYTSSGAHRMSINEIQEMLHKEGWV